jgi:uncharacterized protein HemY
MPPPQINKYISTIQSQLIETPNDKQLNGALGICFLKLKLFDKALPFFEKAMEDNMEDSSPFFLAFLLREWNYWQYMLGHQFILE